MTWVVPLALATLLAVGIVFGRTQPGPRMRRRIAEDPEVGRSMVRSGRGATGRVLAVLGTGSFAVGGVLLLLDGQPHGAAWVLVAVLLAVSRRERRPLQARIAALLDEEVPVTVQDRIRDRFSAAYAAVSLVSFSISRLVVDTGEADGPAWRLVVGFGLLAVAVAAGVAALWSQAWVFSERRWSRGG